MEDERLRNEIETWCRRNGVHFDPQFEKRAPRVQGDRYEMSWTTKGAVQFIDVYPRPGDRVLVQRGSYIARDGAPPEEQRHKGPLQVARASEIAQLLSRLKEHADRADSREMIEVAAPSATSRA